MPVGLRPCLGSRSSVPVGVRRCILHRTRRPCDRNVSRCLPFSRLAAHRARLTTWFVDGLHSFGRGRRAATAVQSRPLARGRCSSHGRSCCRGRVRTSAENVHPDSSDDARGAAPRESRALSSWASPRGLRTGAAGSLRANGPRRAVGGTPWQHITAAAPWCRSRSPSRSTASPGPRCAPTARIAFHKPRGVVTTTRDPDGRPHRVRLCSAARAMGSSRSGVSIGRRRDVDVSPRTRSSRIASPIPPITSCGALRGHGARARRRRCGHATRRGHRHDRHARRPRTAVGNARLDPQSLRPRNSSDTSNSTKAAIGRSAACSRRSATK
jgi:hypothetical protein